MAIRYGDNTCYFCLLSQLFCEMPSFSFRGRRPEFWRDRDVNADIRPVVNLSSFDVVFVIHHKHRTGLATYAGTQGEMRYEVKTSAALVTRMRGCLKRSPCCDRSFLPSFSFVKNVYFDSSQKFYKLFS